MASPSNTPGGKGYVCGYEQIHESALGPLVAIRRRIWRAGRHAGRVQGEPRCSPTGGDRGGVSTECASRSASRVSTRRFGTLARHCNDRARAVTARNLGTERGARSVAGPAAVYGAGSPVGRPALDAHGRDAGAACGTPPGQRAGPCCATRVSGWWVVDRDAGVRTTAGRTLPLARRPCIGLLPMLGAPSWVAAILGFLLLDFSDYVLHRLSHRLRPSWLPHC